MTRQSDQPANIYCQPKPINRALPYMSFIQSNQIQFIHRQYNFKYMIPKSRHLPLLLLLLVSLTIARQQAHDISYSQLQVTQQPNSLASVTLQPQQSVFAHWQYPNTWEISQFLAESLNTDISLPKLSNIDASISFVKDKVSQFLKLSDKAELLAKNIKQLPTMKKHPLLDVQQQEFKALEVHESTLSALNQQINSKAVELQKIVQDMMVKQENPLFKEAALNFEKKALTQKITLFEELHTSAASGKAKADKGQNDKRVAGYFNELDNIFRVQSSLIDEIDTLLKTHNELTILKARVTSLNSQLKAHELTLSEKEECANEFEKIKEKQSHDKQVIKLVETLKQKKLAQSEPNKYCEGVVKKLIERVKKLLIGYDYVFECAQQLAQVRTNRDNIRKQLDEAQKKLDQLQLQKEIETFRSNFDSNRRLISQKVQEMKQSFTLDEHYMYPQTLRSAIIQAKSRISQIEQTIANLPANTNHDLQQIQQRIKQQVNEIMKLKGSYCKENEAYQANAQIVEDVLLKLEQQEEYNNWVRDVLVEKFEDLEMVKAEMRSIQKEIEEHLKGQVQA